MKIYVPDYYKGFKCLMGGCKHSCCIGWEIDIDPETAEFYKNVPGEFGEKLKENIDFCEDGGVFKLCENDRCPFLNKEGLCEIMINLGEEAASQVCDDHPRFRSFFETRIETGLGLCCEAAAKMIIEKEEKTSLVLLSDDGEEETASFDEEEFFAFREKVFFAIQNRSKTIGERIEEMLSLCGAKLPEKSFADWAEIYGSLERLDEEWTKVLESIKKNPAPPEDFDETAAEQLLWYFVFRHLSEAPYDGRLLERAAFAVLSLLMTEKAAEKVGIYEAARLYSSEIEYSDENVEILLDAINKEV